MENTFLLIENGTVSNAIVYDPIYSFSLNENQKLIKWENQAWIGWKETSDGTFEPPPITTQIPQPSQEN